MSSSDQAAEELRARVDQQEVIAELGQRALEADDVDELMADATAAVSETLGTEYCKVLELLPGDEEVVLRQGVGWRDGLVGEARVPTDGDSQAGYTLLTEEPVVVDDLETESRFTGPDLLVDHGVTSGVSVIIGSPDEPWGVLGAHTSERRTFSEHDAAFVRSVANLLAARIENERTTRHLREEETLNDRLVKTSPVGITLIDTDGMNVFANERAEDLLGRSLEELRAYVHDDDRWDLVDENGDPLSGDELPFTRVKETGEPVFDEVIGIKHPDGTRVWLSANCEPLYDANGEFDGGVYALEDITEQKRLENELETTFERISDAFFGLDDDWNFTYLNDRATELIDPEGRGLLGENIWAAFPAASETAIESEYRRAMESQEPISFEEYFPPLSTWFEVRAYPSESGLSVYFRDVTERKRLQTELDEILDRVDDAFYAVNTDWEFTYVNDALADITDVPKDELIGERVWEVFPETVGTNAEELNRRAGETGEPVEFEHYYEPAESWLQATVYPSETGQSVYMRDVTERKEMKRELIGNNRAIQRLYAIASDREQSFDEKVDEILDLGRAYLGVDVGYLASVDEAADRFEVTHAAGESELVYPGSTAPLSDTYCHRTIHSDGLLGITDASTGDEIADGRYDIWEVDCYIGGRVTINGGLYGTLCFEDEAARTSPFTPAEETFVELVTQWVSYELERVEREHELKTYEMIVKTVDDGIYTIGEDGCFTMVNDAYVELTGYDRDALLGSHGSLVVDEGVIGRAQAVANDRTTTKTIEAEIERSDGRRVPVEGTVTGWSDGDSGHGRLGVVRDITERRERQRALAESERRYRTLVENFPNGAVGLFDEDLQYTLAGGELLDALEISHEEVTGTSIYERYPDDIVGEIEPKFRAALDGDESSFEIEYHGRHLFVYTLPLKDADDEVFAGMLMVQDITDRKTNERKLEQTVRKLEISNQRLEQFAYAASHDLQEPLRMVSSYLTLIERRYGDEIDENGREFIAFAVDGANRMREMINGLLTYSRIETRGDPFEPVDCEEIFGEVIGDLQVKIRESRAEITAEPLPQVHGDAGQLRQVFQNLLSNAIKYVDDGPPQIHVSAAKYGQEWHVSVDDNGIGIAEDDTERVFNVFQRLHSIEEYSGAGIGLALCQRIVERHGGRIWIQSEPGVGSTVTFTLPAEQNHV